MLSQGLDLKVDEDILKLHEKNAQIKTFSISGYPRGDLICDLYRESRPFQYIFHYGIHIPKQSNGVAKIVAKANLVRSQLRSPMNESMPN